MTALLKIGDFVDFVETAPRIEPAPQTDGSWNVILIAPQQEVTTVWRMHELGLELYSPIVRRRVSTGRKNKDGKREVRVAPRPMFPGYAFLRCASADPNVIRRINGVRDFLAIHGRPVVLPHEAVMAIRTKEFDEHLVYMAEITPKKRKPRFKVGALVRVDTGPFADLIGNVDAVDGRGRLEILFGMIRVSMDDQGVVAA